MKLQKNIDPNTIALEYLKAPENISNSSSTKIIFPLELSNIIPEILSKVKK